MGQDATAEDWGERYTIGDTPWVLGRPHPELEARLARGELDVPYEGARALVGGAGHGHDAEALARAGWSVTALEIVPALAGELARRVGAEGSVVIGDGLGWRPPEAWGRYELVFEHTFFCAVAPERRGEWGELVRACLVDGGRLVGVAYPIGKDLGAGGPPFGVEPEALREALAAGGEVEWVVDEPVGCGVGRRSYGERWVELRVRG